MGVPGYHSMPRRIKTWRGKRGVSGSNQKPLTPSLAARRKAVGQDATRTLDLRMGGPKTDVCVATRDARGVPVWNLICIIFQTEEIIEIFRFS
jgi:hypothetical protein